MDAGGGCASGTMHRAPTKPMRVSSTATCPQQNRFGARVSGVRRPANSNRHVVGARCIVPCEIGPHVDGMRAYRYAPPRFRVRPVHHPFASAAPVRATIEAWRIVSRRFASLLRTLGHTQFYAACTRVSPQIAYAISIRYANCVGRHRPPVITASSALRTKSPNRVLSPLHASHGLPVARAMERGREFGGSDAPWHVPTTGKACHASTHP